MSAQNTQLDIGEWDDLLLRVKEWQRAMGQPVDATNAEWQKNQTGYYSSEFAELANTLAEPGIERGIWLEALADDIGDVAYTALGLTAVFTILSEYLFNEESSLCIVPHKYRVLHKLIDTNDDGVVTEPELAAAIAVLEKAKREKQRKAQKEAYSKFDFEKFTNGN